jgi:hypothetical protein
MSGSPTSTEPSCKSASFDRHSEWSNHRHDPDCSQDTTTPLSIPPQTDASV